MTTLRSDAWEAGGQRRLLPDSLTSMAWVVWRQHRAALTWLGALLLALGTTMLVAGIELHRLYAAEIRHGCVGSSAWSAVCRPRQTPFAVGWPLSYSNMVVLAMQAVPVIIGVFLGAPLLAREYTAGTVRFTWTPERIGKVSRRAGQRGGLPRADHCGCSASGHGTKSYAPGRPDTPVALRSSDVAVRRLQRAVTNAP